MMTSHHQRNNRRFGFNILVCFFILAICYGVSGVKVLSLQSDIWEAPQEDVFVRFNFSSSDRPTHKDVVRTFTVCYRVRYAALSVTNQHISIASSDENNNALSIYVYRENLKLAYNDRSISVLVENVTVPLQLRQWAHYCHCFQNGTYMLYLDGVLTAQGHLRENVDLALRLNGSLILGQEQDLLSGGFDSSQVLLGNITQVNIWDKLLPEESIEAIANCSEDHFGNLFSSDNDTLELFKVKEVTVPLKDLCNIEPNYLIFPGERTLSEAKSLCYHIGGFPYVPTTKKENTELFKAGLRIISDSTNNYLFWLGATDEVEEGIWRQYRTDKKVLGVFPKGRPNGERKQNCLFMFKTTGFWEDVRCDSNRLSNVACEWNTMRELRLRGLCVDIREKTKIEALGYYNGKPFFHGHYGHMIYSVEAGVWQLQDIRNNGSIIAKLQLPSASMYPLGRHRWQLESSICGHLNGTILSLSLSVCNEKEFTCDNGDCVQKSVRCDHVDDCSDQSDEVNCSMIDLDKGYRKHSPPIRRDPSTSKRYPLQVLPDIRFLRFFKIDDVEKVIFIEFTLFLKWKDHRLRFWNLHNESDFNALSKEEESSIWVPSISFPNIFDGNIKILKEKIYAIKEGEHEKLNINNDDSDLRYNGSVVSVHLQRHYSGSFACAFDVFRYPFDKQHCHLLIEVASVSKELVFLDIEKATATYTGNEILSSYIVEDLDISVIEEENNPCSVIKIGFSLTRRYGLAVITIFMPTLMLAITGYSTLYVRQELLQCVHATPNPSDTASDRGTHVRLVVTLTSLLVLYTLFGQTSSSLPRTAYIKMIDIWFFFCINLIFLVLIFHFYVEYIGYSRTELRNEKKKSKEPQVNNMIGRGRGRGGVFRGRGRGTGLGTGKITGAEEKRGTKVGGRIGLGRGEARQRVENNRQIPYQQPSNNGVPIGNGNGGRLGSSVGVEAMSQDQQQRDPLEIYVSFGAPEEHLSDGIEVIESETRARDKKTTGALLKKYFKAHMPTPLSCDELTPTRMRSWMRALVIPSIIITFNFVFWIYVFAI
ncbi:uncharacterized protein LOC143020140 isoform X2 [Oratosquilla oratoria]